MGADYISFPNLNLKFSISDTIVRFNVFGSEFALKWYGLLIAIGFLLAVLYATKRAKEFDVDPDRMIDVTLVSTIFAFLGARLYYVLFSTDPSYYFEHPGEILAVWNGGLAIYGGIIFAFITAVWMCKVRKVNTLAMFDIASLGFLIGQAIGRWGNFFNQEAFGGNTSDTYLLGMTGSIIKTGLNGTGYNTNGLVHPTFLYESFWCLLGFVLLHFISKKAYKFKGQIFSFYILWYGAGRFFIEGVRTDSLKFGEIRISQMIAVLSVIGGLVLFFLLRAHNNGLPKDLFAEETDGENAIPLNEETTEEKSTEESTDEESAKEEVSDSKDADIENDKPEA